MTTTDQHLDEMCEQTEALAADVSSVRAEMAEIRRMSAELDDVLVLVRQLHERVVGVTPTTTTTTQG